VSASLEASERALLEARRRRRRPAVDDKVIASWNGLAISGFACAYQALQLERYLAAARRGADFVLAKLVDKRRTPALYRRYRDGEAAIDGNLEDYSFLVAGLLDLYEASFEKGWMSSAVMLAEEMVRLFWDSEGGGFFMKPPGGELVAIKDGYDGPTPSGNSVAALDLLRLSEFTGNGDLREMAETTLRLFADSMESSPTGHLQMLGAVDFSLGSKEIVVASRGMTSQLLSMVRELQTRYLPNKVLALADGDERFGPDASMAKLVSGKTSLRGAPTAYICENFACRSPVTDISALRGQLEAAAGGEGRKWSR
jgi:uncharacterized protein